MLRYFAESLTLEPPIDYRGAFKNLAADGMVAALRDGKDYATAMLENLKQEAEKGVPGAHELLTAICTKLEER